MNRLLDDRAFGDVNVTAVVGESRVQRRKGIALRVEVSAEMRFERCRVGVDRVGQARNRHAARQMRRSSRAREQSIRRQRPAGRAPTAAHTEPRSSLVTLFAPGAASWNAVFAMAATLVKRQSSSCVVGKPTSAEARKGILAQFLQPRQVAAGGGLLKALKLSRYVSSCATVVLTLSSRPSCMPELKASSIVVRG